MTGENITNFFSWHIFVRLTAFNLYCLDVLDLLFSDSNHTKFNLYCLDVLNLLFSDSNHFLMSDQQQSLTPSTPSTFYAVSWGHQRGVFENYKDAQAAMKGFPSPVYKKFKDREEAETFVHRSKPDSTSMDVDESFTKFFTVARGRVVGIFKDLETVKKNIKGYPNAMHKKFDKLEEAKHYLEKYFEGKADKKKSPEKSRTSEILKMSEETTEQTADGDDAINAEKGGDEQTKEEDESGAKPVARKRTYGTDVNDEHDVKESKLDLSEGHKALRQEEGDKDEDKKDDEPMEESEKSAINGEQKTVSEDAKMDQKMEEGGEEEKTPTGIIDECSPKKAKFENSDGTKQTSQQ